MPTIDSLDIQISSSVNNANASLTTLIKRLDRVSASLSGVNSRGLATMGAGVNKLSNAMANFSANTRTADFTRLAKNLTALSAVDTSAFGKMASGIASISSSLSKIPNVSDSATKFGELAKGIGQLGYKSATQAITNIPKLAVAMKDLMRTLSGVPKVSQNLIDMTNALAKLARTGASSGRATNSLAKSLDTYTLSTSRARKGSFSLASAIGKLYATYWLLFRAFGKIGDSIDIASNLTEVQNVVDVTFGKYASLVEKMSETSIQDFGMSELTVKQVASRFQAMGIAMGFAQGNMAEMSIELTKLTADMASFYNVEQKDVAEDLASIFTGQTRPLRTYGLDLTEATLKEWAMRQGMQANIDTMSQMEKTMLRYQYVLANTGASQGDFARTSETWSNQIRILKQQFEQLGIVIGKTFISALKPLVKALNSAMSSIIAFAQTVSESLGKIFGWKFEVGGGGITNDLESGADFADDIAGGLGTASDNAKKLKSYLLGIDELNVLDPTSADSLSGGGGSGSGGGGANGNGGQWVETESIFEEFESELDTLYKLGDYIGDKLSDAMESINWDSVYEKARNFGTGLADFLNGLISPRLFGNVGETIANALNTAIYASLSFAEEFDWEEFGESIATGINDFFKNFDFSALSETLNTWVDGIKTTIASILKNLTWSDILESVGEFLGDLELDTVAVLIGAFTWKHGGKELTKTIFSNLFSTKLGIGKGGGITVSSGVTIAVTAITAKIGFDLGKELGKKLFPEDTIYYDNFKWSGEGGFFDTILSDAKTSLIALDELWADMQNNGIFRLLTGTFIFPKKVSFTDLKDSFEELKVWWIKLDEWWKENAPLAWLKKWFEEDVEPWFAEKKWEDLFNNIKIAFENKWQEIVNWWNGTAIVRWWKENVEPWFEKEKWDRLYNTIKTSLKQKWDETISTWRNGISNWWDRNVAPWFTKEKWINLYNTIKTSLVTKWNETVTQWKTNISTWWNNNVSPWFTKEKWISLYDSIKTSLGTKWNETVTTWRTNITNWWNNNVAPWFTENRWLTLLSTIGESFSKAFETAKTNAVNKFTEIYNTISGFVDNIKQKIAEITGTASLTASAALNGINISLKGQGYATGGFPNSADIFYANENGVPELVGTIGHRTAVASGSEITGISSAIYNTGEVQSSLLQTAVGLLQIIADKDPSINIDTRELVSAYDSRKTRNGWQF